MSFAPPPAPIPPRPPWCRLKMQSGVPCPLEPLIPWSRWLQSQRCVRALPLQAHDAAGGEIPVPYWWSLVCKVMQRGQPAPLASSGSRMDAPSSAPCQCSRSGGEGARGLRRAAAPSLPEEPASCVVNRIQPELFIRSADCGFSAWMLH